MKQQKLTVKRMYKDYEKFMESFDFEKHKTEMEILMLEQMRVIKKGVLKAGKGGIIIKIEK